MSKIANDMVFYGQDLTSLEKAYVVWNTEDGAESQSIKGDNYLKGFLWALMEDLDKAGLIVGHSDKEIDNKDDYKLCKWNPLAGEDAEKRQFGSLVGTIRKEYTKEDTATHLITFIENNKKNSGKSKISEQARKVISKLTKRQGARNTEKVSIKLVILSRFDKFDVKNPGESKPYFLASMLLKGKLNLELDRHHVDFDYNSLFDFYLLWVMMEHFRAASLKGFFKKYQRFERNDDRLRGSIDIARHIRMNMGMNNGKIAYSYRENSLDNMVNHLILTAYDHLKDKYPNIVEKNFDVELEQKLKSLKYEIGYPKYDRRTIIAKNSTPVSHPFFSEYRDLQQDCLMILRDEGVSPFGNTDEHLDGILYYVPDLWEEYLENYFNRIIRKLNKEIKDDETRNPYVINMTAQEDILVMSDMDGEGGHKTMPDYIFRYKNDNDNKKSGKSFFILDAKYRKGWLYALDGKLDKALMGDYDKCIRDMVSVAGSSSGVVFPVSAEEVMGRGGDIQFVHTYSKENQLNYFYTLPVSVHKSEGNNSFAEWQREMEDSIKRTCTILEEVLKFEADRKMKIDEALRKIQKESNEKMNGSDGLVEKYSVIWTQEEQDSEDE